MIEEQAIIGELAPPNANAPVPGGIGWAKLFGYDVFISFALGKGPRGTQAYAVDLARKLRERDLTVFISEDEIVAGSHLDSTLTKALHASRLLVVLANHGTLTEPRYVRMEVDVFRARHPRRGLVPVNIAGALEDPRLASATHEWLKFRQNTWLNETAQAVGEGMASEETVIGIARAASKLRSTVRLRMTVIALLGLFAGIALFAWAQRAAALKAQGEAVEQATIARKAADAAVKARDAEREQRKRAEAQLRIAQSLQGAAESSLAVPSRLDHALALAARAVTVAPTHEAYASLLRASQAISPALRYALNGHRHAVAALLLDPSGRRLFSGDVQGQVIAWDLAGRRVIRVMRTRGPPDQIQSITSLALRPDGKQLAAGTNTDNIFAWNLKDSRELGEVIRGDMAVSSLEYSADGRSLRALGHRRDTLQDRSEPVPDSLSVKPAIVQTRAANSHSSILAWSRDSDDAIVLEEVRTKVRHVLPPPRPDLKDMTSATLSADGHQAAVTYRGGTVVRWNLAGDTPKPSVLPTRLPENASQAALSADGRELALGLSNGQVVLSFQDERGGHRYEALNGHQGGITGLRFFDEQNQLISADARGAILLWDLARAGGPADSGLSISALEALRSLALAQSPRRLDGGTVLEFNGGPGAKQSLRVNLAPAQAVIAHASISHGGGHLVTVLKEPRAFAVASLSAPYAVINWTVPERLALDNITLKVASGGARLATFSSGGQLVLIDPLRRAPVKVPQTGSTSEWNNLDFSGDGRRLAWANEHGLALLDASDGRFLGHVSKPTAKTPRAIRSDRRGNQVALLIDNEVQLWQLPFGKSPQRRLAVPLLTKVPHMQFSGDGRVLYIEQHANQVRHFIIWNLDTGEEVRIDAPWPDVEPKWRVSDDDRWLVARQGDRSWVWPVGLDVLVQRGCALTRDWQTGAGEAARDAAPAPMPPCSPVSDLR